MQKDTRSVANANTKSEQTEEIGFSFYKKQFISAVKWNTIESVLYQLIFITHQTFLFSYCDRALYGKAGSLFSLSYLTITFLIAGLDGGLLPFFHNFITHRKSFNYLLKTYIFTQLCFVAGVVGLGAIVATTFFYKEGLIVALLAFFVVAEATKKLLKHLLYLAFYNRYTALLEVTQIALYVTTVWVLYFSGCIFSLPLLFLPFIATSTLFSLVSFFLLRKYAATLSEDTVPFSLPSPFSFLQVRASVLINQLCRSLFSTNFLVPLFALHGGFVQAGLMTFANYCTHTCAFLMYKIAIPPAEALLSRVKQYTFYVQLQAMKLILVVSLSLAALCTLLFLFKGEQFINNATNHSFTNLTWMIFAFFFFIHLLENMFIVYEKFFLLQNKVHFLALCNVITCLLCLALSQCSLSFFSLIGWCIGIRFMLFFFLSFFINILKNPLGAHIKAISRRWPLLNVFYFDNEINRDK